MELLGGQHAVWGRVRVLVGGQELEQLDHYPRLVTQQLKLSPQSYIENYVAMGPGIKNPYPTAAHEYFDMRWLKPGQSKTVTMPLFCGLLAQPKWLPCKWMGPLSFMLELADPAMSCRTGTTGNPFVVTFTSNYSISDVQFKADFCTLDSELEASFSSTLLSGRALTLGLNTWAHTAHGTQQGTKFR